MVYSAMLEFAYIAKWLHLCLVLLLLGGLVASYSLTCVLSRGVSAAAIAVVQPLLKSLQWITWLAVIVLAATGSALVYPKGYTWSTPWIEAAYLFLALAVVGLWAVFRLKRAVLSASSRPWQWLSYHALNAVLLVILVVIAYEAVSKTTFLPLG